MQKITPFLWFDGKAEEAMNFYTSVFKNSKKGTVSYWGEGTPYPKGSVMSATFELEGMEFFALNGGPMYKFTPAISMYVNCETQEEVDNLWNNLIADGGKESMCGWLVDKYGMSWQIIPSALTKLMHDKDAEKSKRVVQAMMKMNKIIIQDLQDAYDGK
ncbi:MAG: VOC family protein [Bacteroidota bacterium]